MSNGKSSRMAPVVTESPAISGAWHMCIEINTYILRTSHWRALVLVGALLSVGDPEMCPCMIADDAAVAPVSRTQVM